MTTNQNVPNDLTQAYYQMLLASSIDRDNKLSVAGNVFGLTVVQAMKVEDAKSLGEAKQICMDFIDAWFIQAGEKYEGKKHVGHC